ncbi:MAG: alpha/beta hydrolase-fold protein [Bryobacteraceae bacterium]
MRRLNPGPLFLLLALPLLAEDPTPKSVLAMARSGSPELDALIGAEKLEKGTGWYSLGPDFVFAVRSAARPELIIDDGAPIRMAKNKAGVWYAATRLATGRTHNFFYRVDGKPFGGVDNVPAFGPYSYEKPGVPRGTLDGKHVHTSTIYPGMKSDYWVYAPAQYDGSTPAAFMIWQDGQGLSNREMPSRAQIVFDNLTHEKKIPVIIHIMVSPGMIGDRRMRSVQYDTVNDTYVKFIRDEIVTEVSKKYKLRQDGYSHAIAGNSSGGICAFNAAYLHPEYFSRVLSRIGSFTSIQWQPGVIDGGNIYPFKIRKEDKRNIRVWLQDGAGDLENNHGSWPAQNIAMANSLKMKGYDFHFSWGNGSHSGNAGNSELAEELIWLWRDYDPARTSQEFTMDPAEKDKPYFRVKALNRE